MKKADMDEIGQILLERHLLLKAIRTFFYELGYIEVETPCLMQTAPPDPYIEPLRVSIDGKRSGYLHTSPEMGMKQLLGKGQQRIFQICRAFRVEEFEEHHNVEFTMLEWYRPGTYLDAMEETEHLVRFAADALCSQEQTFSGAAWKVLEVGEVFHQIVGFNPLPLSRRDLASRMEEMGFQGIREDDTWEDLFFKLLVQEIEPKMEEKGPYFLKDWPASLTAMAKRKDEHRVERFELYINGLEIANGYTELLDPQEQRQRLTKDNEGRAAQGKPTLAVDEAFLRSLARIAGPVAGVSIGVDRLLMVLTGKKLIGEVLPLRFGH
jgi:elongation factor P--(R)-beta-lysine ligase